MPNRWYAIFALTLLCSLPFKFTKEARAISPSKALRPSRDASPSKASRRNG